MQNRSEHAWPSLFDNAPQAVHPFQGPPTELMYCLSQAAATVYGPIYAAYVAQGHAEPWYPARYATEDFISWLCDGLNENGFMG